jgi:hypothetical protein
MARIDDRNVSVVLAAAAEVFSQNPPVRLESRGFRRTAGDYVEVAYEPAPAIMALHSAIVLALAPLRFIPSDYSSYREDYFDPYNREQRANVEEFGYDLAHELFRPHITLARLPSDASFGPSATQEDYTFVATSGAVFEADAFGAGSRVIRHLGLGV